jgi:hypothetical protein
MSSLYALSRRYSGNPLNISVWTVGFPEGIQNGSRPSEYEMGRNIEHHPKRPASYSQHKFTY